MAPEVAGGGRTPPWRRLVLLALLGTSITVACVLLDLSRYDHVAALLYVGENGSAAEAVRRDIPAYDLAVGRGHDGQQFYAVARSPLDLDEAGRHLDRPRYRLQRPLFPWLASALHPWGGGTGLVIAMAVVGVAGVILSGVAAGALASQLGGGTWPALVIPTLPGAYTALRISLADSLALGLVLLAIYGAERRRTSLAVAASVAAVLAKESMLLLVVAHAVTRRTRASVLAAVSATLTSATWWLLLRLLVDTDEPQVREFIRPFGGVIGFVDEWLGGSNPFGFAMYVGTFTLAAIALWRRGPKHPLFGPLVAISVFATCLATSVVVLDFNGTRTLGPMLVLAILTLGTPTEAGMKDVPATPVPSG